MKARRLLAILMREPLNYEVVRQRGSHRTLKAPGRPTVRFAFHDRSTLAPGEVRDVFCEAGLDQTEALDLL
jgi:predicted RNA binding protein YcfA (HicA-like mRNA interferase family)